MSRITGAATGDLLAGARIPQGAVSPLADGAVLLRSFAEADETTLMAAVQQIAAAAPFRRMTTPGGYRMSVAMTNCGRAGWVTDRKGYRYAGLDPLTERPWPAMPAIFQALADRAAAMAGFGGFAPDSCLINRYEPGTRLSLHQDRNERDFAAPIVSVSLGLPAIFRFGGLRRRDRPRPVPVESGDIVVWGGPARLAFHGVDTLAAGDHPLTGNLRINLTLRKAL
jgi:DNA oxidative demethylase